LERIKFATQPAGRVNILPVKSWLYSMFFFVCDDHFLCVNYHSEQHSFFEIIIIKYIYSPAEYQYMYGKYENVQYIK